MMISGAPIAERSCAVRADGMNIIPLKPTRAADVCETPNARCLGRPNAEAVCEESDRATAEHEAAHALLWFSELHTAHERAESDAS